MKIVTKKASRFGRDMNFPLNGLGSISADGVADVSNECADLMVKSGAGWEYADEKAAAKAEKAAAKKEVVEEVAEEVTEEVTEEVVEEVAEVGGIIEADTDVTEDVDMSKMSKEQLKQVLKDAGVYNGAKHGKMSAPKLIATINELMS